MFITILYFTSMPRLTILLHVHHHTVLYVSARGHNPSTTTSPYPTSLPGVTILLQLHHHTVLYVFARVHSPSTSTSPYCTLRLCPGRNPSTSTSPYSTIRLRPGSQSFYKYITILYFTSLPGVTILLQVHHHTVLYISALGHNPSTSTYHSFLNVSAQGPNPSTSTSPYCTPRLCAGSQFFYKYITILYVTSLPGVTILLQVHHHTVLFVSARGRNPSTSTSPYFPIRLCPGSQSFHKYITILYLTSLPVVTILLQVHHHTVLYLSVRGHSPSTSTSPYSTSLPGVTVLLNVYHYIVFMSLPGATILLQGHHHIVLCFSALGHNPSKSASPCCTLRLCPGSQSFYKYITILRFTSLPGVTIPLKLHHHTVCYVSVRGHNASTSSSPCCT